jgi:hypothetical protein
MYVLNGGNTCTAYCSWFSVLLVQINRNVSNTRPPHEPQYCMTTPPTLHEGKSCPLVDLRERGGVPMCIETLFIMSPLSKARKAARVEHSKESRQKDYIRADFDLDCLDTSPNVSKPLLFCTHLSTCSCTSTLSLVPLVLSAQRPFWPLGPQAPELRPGY